MPADVVDGAVFAFAQGTDPELLVLLEARRSGESLAWHYAFGSATLFLLEGYVDETQVWTDRQKFADKTYLMRY